MVYARKKKKKRMKLVNILQTLSTMVTQYSLVYKIRVFLPLECQISSLQIAIQEWLTEEENATLRLQELEGLNERTLKAQQSLQCY